MQPGETKKVTIQAERAYGKRDESLIRKIARSLFPDSRVPAKGMSINLYLPDGGAAAATIIAVDEREITVDLNHPLADKDLTFEVTVAAIE